MLMVTPQLMQLHFDYSAWASARLVGAAAELSPDELNRDFGTSDKSVLGTLVHVFAADRIWMARVEGREATKFVSRADYDLAVLQAEWPVLYLKWKAWAESLSDASLLEDCAYKDMKGNPHRTPRWQIGLHVVNHATHHRGQVSGFLRVMGKTPPPLDLVFYYREKKAA